MKIDFSTVLKRALMAGVAVGVLMGAYMFLVVEPTVDEAIELEESFVAAQPVGAGAEDAEPLFSRDEQTAGGVAANLVYAAIVSCIFGVVYAKVRHRLPGASDFVRSVSLAAVAFGAVALIPAIKYPANPPAVGDPDTVNERTVQYLALIILSLVAAVGL
ncbi:MAG: CbtA family protein, partial [Acidimicrobiales bacterium]|nr:CbtA family protein [Acidimicrobiales bacterium]